AAVRPIKQKYAGAETTVSSRSIELVVRIVSLKEQPTDSAHWQRQPYHVRLAALEVIRREYHGWHPDIQPRIECVCRIVPMRLGHETGKCSGMNGEQHSVSVPR